MKLEQTLFGVPFQNPVLLAAGTCGFGRELRGVLDLERLGGLATKSVTLEPRWGNPAPRVTELAGGMLNSVGLTNPGAEAVRDRELPWLAGNVRAARIFVSVAGHTAEEFFRIVEMLEGSEGFLGFEINLSCPNDHRRAGVPFALDPDAVRHVVGGIRARTGRPILAKLAPNDPDLRTTVAVAEDAGADGLTLVNTMPGLALDPGDGAPRIGAGEGGVSGPALHPVGVRAVRTAREATDLPLVGVGGILSAEDAISYLRAGAALVQVGTASFADPRASLRIVRDLARWGRRRGIRDVADLRGGSRASGPRPEEPRPSRGAVAAAVTAPEEG